MDIRLIFLCLTFLISKGVFGDPDEVMSVSVMEGHCVTLHTDAIKQKDDMMVWHYGPENTFLATINGKASNTKLYDGEDERFTDRLKLGDQTGDLTISDTRTSDSGLYTLKISRNNKASYKRFNVTVSGVFTGDEVKSVSVREGHSVILYTHVLKQNNDLMEWRFGPENTFVAKINGETGRTKLSTEERFRDRVKLEDQTGALMISDTTSHHSGLYQFRINSNNKVSFKTFHVTIHAHLPVPVISPQNRPSSERSSSSKCVFVCSVMNVRHVTLTWYNGSIIQSNISVSDLNISIISLPLEVEYQDTNTYTCVLNNPITNQTQHLHTTDVCQTCSDSRVMWVCVIPVVLLICICVCILVRRADPMKASHALKDDESSINSSIMSDARSPSSNIVKVWVKQN